MFTVRVKKSLPKDVKICLPRREKTPYHVVAKSSYRAQSKDDYIILYLSDSKLTPRWFYKGMLDQLGLGSRFYRGDSKRQLQKEIEIIRGVQHKKVVCILDEAHLIEKKTLEEFRFLFVA